MNEPMCEDKDGADTGKRYAEMLRELVHDKRIN